MTKKEMFAEIVTVATAAEREDIVEFANKEIELLNKRSSKESKAAKAKAEERATLKAQVLDFVGGEDKPVRTMEIATALGVSPQKITPVLSAMVKDGDLNATVEKKVKLFTVAVAEEPVEAFEEPAE